MRKLATLIPLCILIVAVVAAMIPSKHVEQQQAVAAPPAWTITETADTQVEATEAAAASKEQYLATDGWWYRQVAGQWERLESVPTWVKYDPKKSSSAVCPPGQHLETICDGKSCRRVCVPDRQQSSTCQYDQYGQCYGGSCGGGCGNGGCGCSSGGWGRWRRW